MTFANTDFIDDETAALTDGQYVGFTINADSGFTLDLTNISFGIGRTNSAPRRVTLFIETSKETGFTQRTNKSTNSTTTINADDYRTFDLTTLGTDFSGVTSAEFRFVFHEDNASRGLGYLENVAL